MDKELNKKYHENGALKYEKTVLLNQKTLELMSEIATLGSNLYLVDDKTVLQISDKLDSAYLAMSELNKILTAQIAKVRARLN